MSTTNSTLTWLPFTNESRKLPAMLNYGEQALFILPIEFKNHIAGYINTQCGGLAQELHIVSSSTTKEFRLVVAKPMLIELNAIAAKQRG